MIVKNSLNSKLFVVDTPGLYYCSNDGINLTALTINNYYNFTPCKSYFFNGKYYFITKDSDTYDLWSFSGYTDKRLIFNKIREKRDDGKGNFQKFTHVGTNQYILESDDGIFLVRNSDVIRLSYSDISFRSVKYVDFGIGDPMYYYAIGKDINRVSNYKKMSNRSTSTKFLTLPTTVNEVHDILPKNQYEFMFATDVGFYTTTYQYVLSNDLTFFTDIEVN